MKTEGTNDGRKGKQKEQDKKNEEKKKGSYRKKWGTEGRAGKERMGGKVPGDKKTIKGILKRENERKKKSGKEN